MPIENIHIQKKVCMLKQNYIYVLHINAMSFFYFWNENVVFTHYNVIVT